MKTLSERYFTRTAGGFEWIMAINDLTTVQKNTVNGMVIMAPILNQTAPQLLEDIDKKVPLKLAIDDDVRKMFRDRCTESEIESLIDLYHLIVDHEAVKRAYEGALQSPTVEVGAPARQNRRLSVGLVDSNSALVLAEPEDRRNEWVKAVFQTFTAAAKTLLSRQQESESVPDPQGTEIVNGFRGVTGAGTESRSDGDSIKVINRFATNGKLPVLTAVNTKTGASYTRSITDFFSLLRNRFNVQLTTPLSTGVAAALHPIFATYFEGNSFWNARWRRICDRFEEGCSIRDYFRAMNADLGSTGIRRNPEKDYVHVACGT